MYEIYAIQGLKYFAESIKQKINGPTRYKGNAQEICKQIVQKCWNGKYFQASTHHYKEFWARDFGYSAESLVKMGYKQEAIQTIKYALDKYNNGIKTTITFAPYSFPNTYSPDSVALMFEAITKTKFDIEPYRERLQKETDTFANIVVEDGRVRKAHFAGMRDHAHRNSSCYDHCM